VGASLLQMAIRGFESPCSARMQSTYARIQARLMDSSLYFRNEIAIKRGEGIFHACSFWDVQFLAQGGGTLAQAKEAFANALLCCNDVGLLSEEINPKTKEALGNFPQGLSHASLINAALAIQNHEKKV
jgi:alpha,alpha-trehalase